MKTLEVPRVAIVGSHGIPANYGGFETFAEQIAVHLCRNHGYRMTVVGDAEQERQTGSLPVYRGVALRYARHAKSTAAIRFYYDSIRNVVADHDIIYSCGPAGALFGPLVRGKGKIMMTNPDGLNSYRSKWSRPIKMAFRLFEWASCRFSDRVICDSKEIERYVLQSYGCRHTDVIEYGAHANPWLDRTDAVLAALGDYALVPEQYHLVVSRLEPENNLETIVRGYQAGRRAWPLVVVGNLKQTEYVAALQRLAGPMVRFLGGIYEKEKLAALRAGASSYLHGHSVGGTNPSLLEAMGSRNLCICHDNPFNREVLRDNGLFFADADGVDAHLVRIESGLSAFNELRAGVLRRVVEYYNWDNMAAKYHQVFMRAFESQGK